jgi:hypothetical protein
MSPGNQGVFQILKEVIFGSYAYHDSPYVCRDMACQIFWNYLEIVVKI